jgi:hypothetical protein
MAPRPKRDQVRESLEVYLRRGEWDGRSIAGARRVLSWAGYVWSPSIRKSVERTIAALQVTPHGDMKLGISGRGRRPRRGNMEPTYPGREESLRANKDTTPRYAPRTVLMLGRGEVPVTSVRFYPPGQHPPRTPIVKDVGALELVTPYGSRWYGFDRGYINAQLRMVVEGFDKRDEVRSRWAVVPTKYRVKPR